MVHKGVTTQWVGTAIDALQHPRRWNIWLLTRSQNSLALPRPYGATAREARGDSVGINTHSQRSTFPPSREPASAARCKLLPRLRKEVRAVVVVGGWDERERTETLKVRVAVLHLDGEDLTLSSFWGGLLVKQLHMTHCRKCVTIHLKPVKSGFVSTEQRNRWLHLRTSFTVMSDIDAASFISDSSFIVSLPAVKFFHP